MSRPRRKFSREFKLQAIEQSYTCESIAELASDLEVRPALLYRWRSEFKSDKKGSFPGEGNEKLSPEALENRKLKKALREKELELEILKKAIGIFSVRDGKSMGS